MNNQTRHRRSPAAEKPGLAARLAAAGLLAAVLDRKMPLDAALETDPLIAGLEPRDRALARAIVGVALRRRGSIVAILSGLMEKPPRSPAVAHILEVGAAQLLFMDVPDHAAVALAVDAADAAAPTRPFKGLVNAVLRRLAREREAPVATAAPDADTPPWLMARWRASYGADTAEKIAIAHRLEPYLDLSVKRDAALWAEKLGGVALPGGTVRTLPAGSVADLPGFADGEWWVQDAAAALPVALLGDVRGKRVADLCAAPGGKTSALVRGGAAVTAVDAAPARMARVRENLARLRYDAETAVADVLGWRPAEAFDAVLLDAPCSATGTIRRHPDVIFLKHVEDIASLATLQSRLLAAAAAMVKPGGTLVFCTCSLEPEEGEAHLAEVGALGFELQPIDPAEVGGLSEVVAPTGALRTLPCHLAGETPRLSGLDGFFAMRLKKL